MAALIAATGWLGVAYHPYPSLVAKVGPPGRPPAAAGLGWLHTGQGRILDSLDRTVLLRGFNDDALLSRAYNPAPLDATDAALMDRAGFDVVRLPIAWSSLEPRRGHIDPGYLRRIQAAVDLLNRHHLWVVLDMHIGIAWGPSSEVPGWARVPAVPDIEWFPVSHWQETMSPANLAGVSYFWISQDWQRDFAFAWRAVARLFRNDPGLAGYDIFNEPHVLPLPPRVFDEQWMWPFYQRMVKAIGAVDPNHLFIVESTLFSNFPTSIVHLAAPDLVYSPHFYVGSLVSAPGRQTQAIGNAMAMRSQEAAQVPAVLWVGELGINHKQSNAVSWTNDVLNQLDRLDAGWAWWQWRQDFSWGIRSRKGQVDTSFLRQLARPFLAAAPPGISSTGADGVNGRLLLRVPPSLQGTPVLISWSQLTLPPPRVVGSCVSSWRWEADLARISVQVAPDQACTISVSAA